MWDSHSVTLLSYTHLSITSQEEFTQAVSLHMLTITGYYSICIMYLIAIVCHQTLIMNVNNNSLCTLVLFLYNTCTCTCTCCVYNYFCVTLRLSLMSTCVLNIDFIIWWLLQYHNVHYRINSKDRYYMYILYYCTCPVKVRVHLIVDGLIDWCLIAWLFFIDSHVQLYLLLLLLLICY